MNITLKITIKDQVIELTMEEARELKRTLSNILSETEPLPYQPYAPQPIPSYPIKRSPWETPIGPADPIYVGDDPTFQPTTTC